MIGNKIFFIKFLIMICLVLLFTLIKTKENISYDQLNKMIKSLEQEKFNLYNEYLLKYLEYQQLKNSLNLDQLAKKKLEMVPSQQKDFIHIFVDIEAFTKFFSLKSKKSH